MKARIVFALVTLVLPAQAQTQVQTQAQTPLQQMVQTEQAFSRMAAEQNTRDAFMQFIADDGLLFRPIAVNGKQWMREHPVPPSDKHPLLAWQPASAGMAAAGDLGFTTGPWEAKEDIKDEKPSGYGHFVTVWKRQSDGSWKFVVDLGISHPQSGGPQTLWRPEDKSVPRVQTTVDVGAVRKALLKLDRAYSRDSLENGLVNAFRLHTSPDVRIYRNGSLPIIGQSEAVALLRGDMAWTPRGGDVSRSADLGYTYGVYDVTDTNKKVIERGSYLRIWKIEFGRWRVVLDVANSQQ
jgi:ketosteroid isomerase-like protein